MKLAVPPGAGRWVRRRQAGLAGAGLVVVAAVARILVDRGMKAPVVLCDEFIYSNIAKNLAQHGHYLLRGTPRHQSYAYPLLLAPAWFFRSMTTTYAVAKGITAAAMVLSAVPVYMWGRRLAPTIYALLAAALTLLLPAFFYSALLMTEGVFLPAFVLASFAIAVMLERPTWLQQLAAFGAIVLAVSIRVQGVVLFLAVPTAVALKLLLDLRAGHSRAQVLATLRRFWPSAVLLVGGATLYAGYKIVQGAPLASGLGAYQELGQRHYPLVSVVRWAVKHLAELGLAVGLVPVSALIVLVWLALRGSATSEAERAFLAVVPAVMLWVLVEVGAFAATVTPFIFERYTFYLAPLLMLAFVVWLRRGLPRPVVGTTVALGLPILLLMLLSPAATIVPDPVNGVTVDSLYKLSLRLPGRIEELKLAVGAAILLAVFLFAVCDRPVARFALPVLLLAYLGAASKPAFDDIRGASVSTRYAAGPDPSWVVKAIGKHRNALYMNAPSSGAAPQSNVLLETEFWNPNVAGVYDLGPGEICGLTETPARIDVTSGRVVPSLPSGIEFAVIPRQVPVDGQLVATGGPPDGQLALYRTPRFVRIGRISTGVYSDGWMGSEASYSVYGSRKRGPGRLVVTLGRAGWSGPDVPGRVRITVGRPAGAEPRITKAVATRRWVVHRLTEKTFTFDGLSPPLRVEVVIKPTFSPAQFGGPDTRALGAQVSFGYASRKAAAR